MCKNCLSIFKKPDEQSTNHIGHEIITGLPIFIRNRRIPHASKENVGGHIENLLNNEIIQPNVSAWSFQLADKKIDALGERKTRMVIDYRILNKKSVDNLYMLPSFKDVLDKLVKAQYFSVLDLATGHHQILM